MSDTPVAPALSSIISDNNGPVSSGAERSPQEGRLGSQPAEPPRRKSRLSVKTPGEGAQGGSGAADITAGGIWPVG